MALARLNTLRKGTKIEKAALALPLILQGKRIFDFARVRWAVYKNSKNFSFKIRQGDYFAAAIMEWCTERAIDVSPNVIVVSKDERYNHSKKGWDYDTIFSYDESFSFEFTYNDNIYYVTFLKGEQKDTTLLEEIRGELNNDSKGHLIISTKTREALESLKGIFQEVLDAHLNRAERKNFKVYVGGGNWKETNRERRPLSSVVLKEGQKERIVNDLQKFINGRESYLNKGLPWRRGYLFEGPPGTGKSSIIQGLASHFDMDLYYLSLGDLTKDAELIQAVSAIEGNGVLLLEDVDVFGATHSRDPKSKESAYKMSMSALLNVLDGPATPDGLITFMTTNHRENLDPALIRKGRIDLEEKISLPDLYQIEGLWRNFYGDEPMGISSIPLDKPTAFYFDVFKTHMEDPEAARQILIDQIASEIDEGLSV